MFGRILAATVVFVVMALVAGAGWLVWVGGWHPADEPNDAQPDDEAKDRLAEEAAIAVIAAESRAIDADQERSFAMAEAPTQAPPDFEPAPLPVREPTPPPDYAFVSRHDVAWGPMTAADVDRSPSPPPVWMATGEADLTALAEAAGRDWTFGWVKLAEDADVGDLGAVLEAQGGAVLGRSGAFVRARLPGDAARLRAIAASAPVAGLGAFPAAHKVPDTLVERARADGSVEVPVWITLMDDDAGRRWYRSLEDLGAQVGHFDPVLRTYAAALPLGALERVAAADYVLAVEAIGRLEPVLEYATALLGTDAVRVFDESTNLFEGVGGASVPLGVMDTGLNLNHPDISSNRRSICGINLADNIDGWEGEDEDLWFDRGGHGTLVTGIALGNGAMNRKKAGIAPLVQDIRMAKVVPSGWNSTALGFGRAMDWLAKPTECGEGVPRKPLVINASIGVRHSIWEGRSVVERKIDASVSAARQLFVVAAANAGEAAYISTAGAKNALSVGGTSHHGDIWSSSSRGPTFDGRLFPKVVTLARSVATTAGGRRGATYSALNGTSLASPQVAGVAALVMDAVPELREEPPALRAHLMASAIKPDSLLADPSAFPTHNTDGPGRLQNSYGLGRVSARTAVLNRDSEDGWTGGTAAFDMDPGRHAYRDIEVPPGASRLDVVLTWDEPPAEPIENPMIHDLDLWVDPDVKCGSRAACGDYQSRSRIDNVEWVIVRNPAPGTYRVKALPNRIYGPAPRAGLAWTVIRGESTPSLAVTVDEDEIEVGPDEPFDVEVAVSADGYVATGTVLRVDCRGADGSDVCHDLDFVARGDSRFTREDGMELTLERGLPDIETMYSFGELGPGERQPVTLRVTGRPEGSFRLHFTATGWNARIGSDSVGVTVGDAPRDAPLTRRPANDDFAAATRLLSEAGETTVDLFHATGELGGPGYLPYRTAPRPERRSVWFVWTAPRTGLFGFTLPRALWDDYSENVSIGVFEGKTLPSLVEIGTQKRGGGNTFFAEADRTYRIRLSVATTNLAVLDPVTGLARQRSTPVLTLRWAPAVRPANDDYARATLIDGASGGVAGNNQAATTEPGELMGHTHRSSSFVLGPDKAASVWYRWTAPSAGDWRFTVGSRSLNVGVYVGDSVADARLVSDLPGRWAVFPAAPGVDYHISVSVPDAYFSGGDFDLSWGPGDRVSPEYDDFAQPQMVAGNRTAARVDMDALTVEAGEPVDSGSRTAWFAWIPQQPGRHVWRVSTGSEFSSSLRQAPLQISVFEGDELASLRTLVVDDATDEVMRPEVVIDAREVTRYRLAVGLPRSAAEVPLGRQTLVLEIGESPANDDLAQAAILTGTSGSTTGSTRFATVAPGELSGPLGDSSLWWTYEVNESAWLRFAVDGPDGTRIAIYRRDGYGGLELVDTSRPIGNTPPVVSFRAEAGVEYVVRVGAYIRDAAGFGGYTRGSFELTWGPGAPPARLRYVQGIADEFARDDTATLFRILGEQAFNDDGTEHYLASDLGLKVFARDTESGRLTLSQTIHDFPVSADAKLQWDGVGDALLVAFCGDWWRFTAREDGGLEYAGVLGGAPCPGPRILLHGSQLINVDRSVGLDIYDFDTDHTSLSLTAQLPLDGVMDAVVAADGANLYAVAELDGDNVLYAMARDTETGELTITSTIDDGTETGDGAVVAGLRDVIGMAVSGTHLFLTLGDNGADTMVFDLADRSSPVFVGVLDAFFNSGFLSECRHASARRNANALDVFCAFNGHYYTVQVGPDGLLLADDYGRLRPGELDGFGDPLPPWPFGRVDSLAASPDGRHLYVAGAPLYFFSYGELAVFERVHGKGD